jgi:hypothetical protein
MKLSNWAKKQGISYITAWRWFNEGRLPVKAYRSDSGTIIVQDESESSEQVMSNPQSNDVMSMVLKKTVEFSKNNGTVEDFAAWILSTFSLRLNTGTDSPKYSRVKPKPEDIQKHFQQFLKTKDKPKLGSFVASEETLDEIVRSDGLGDNERLVASLEVTDAEMFTAPVDMELNNSLSELFVSPASSIITTHDGSTGGLVTRSVDSTPQLNYTGSTNNALGSNFVHTSLSHNVAPYATAAGASQYFDSSSPMKIGTTNANSLFLSNVTEAPTLKAPERARRGRKPAKSFGK